MSEITLGPLDKDETIALANLVSGNPLDLKRADELYRETEGNPLFIVESVRMAAGQISDAGNSGRRVSQSSQLSTLHTPLPPKVQAVIEARLAQLSSQARELAGLAAAIGRSFTADILIASAGCAEEVVVAALEELWQRRIIRSQGGDDYDFSHDKIREVAYATVTPAQRRLWHRRVARALETVHTANRDVILGQLAMHHELAGHLDQALDCYRSAAKVASGAFANPEAVHLLRRALALLPAMPDTPGRTEQELELQMALGAALVTIYNYSHPEVTATYNKARALCVQLASPPSPPVLRGLALASLFQGETEQASNYGQQLLSQTMQKTDPVLHVEAHYIQGVIAFWQGNYSTSRAHLEWAIENYDPAQRHIHLNLYAQDPMLICQIRLALTFWYLGYPDRALALCHTAIAEARSLAHPLSLTYVLTFAIWLHIECGTLEEARQLTQELYTVIEEFGLHTYWLLVYQISSAFLDVQCGSNAVDIASFLQLLHEYEVLSFSIGYTFYAGLVVRLCLWTQEFKQADNLLDKMQDLTSTISQPYLDAEIHRLRGELLWRQGVDPEVVEACFVSSQQIAQQQQAKSLELRAVARLARLWSEQARVVQARETLYKTYQWFTEGFNITDLQEANALLQELTQRML